MLPKSQVMIVPYFMSFNGHPPLGVNATLSEARSSRRVVHPRFNGHPPLGVNATAYVEGCAVFCLAEFQWAPTLGGECRWLSSLCICLVLRRFNGHPPLGVNATTTAPQTTSTSTSSFNGHPPLGVNATQDKCIYIQANPFPVSMGTHPWG